MTDRPLLRFVVGLACGFVGAVATIEVVARIDSARADDPAVEMLDVSEFDRFCGPDLDAVSLSNDSLSWRCAGVVNGVFIRHPIDISDVCAMLGGSTSAELFDETSPNGWGCVDD